MSNAWDEFAADWDDNKDVIQYSTSAFRSLLDVISIDNRTVLDFGCGTGCLTEQIARRASHVVGLDTSPAMLAVLDGKSRSNITTVEQELTEVTITTHPAFNTAFDLIVASSVCGFLTDYEGTLCLLKSCLAPGGWFVQWDWLAADDDADHGLTEAAIRNALNSIGFERVSITTSFSMESEKGKMDVLMGIGRNPERKTVGS